MSVAHTKTKAWLCTSGSSYEHYFSNSAWQAKLCVPNGVPQHSFIHYRGTYKRSSVGWQAIV